MYVVLASWVTVASPTNVITGDVVSSTITVLVTGVAALPEESLTLYVTVYVPVTFSSAVLVVIILDVILPS